MGANSRGTYVRMGRGSVYYQKYLHTNSGRQEGEPAPLQPAANQELANVIQTASTSSLQDSSATELLHDLTAHYRKQPIAPFVIALTALGLVIAMLASVPIWLQISFLAVGVAAHIIATKADYRRKTVHLDYSLEPDAAQAYVGFLRGSEQLRYIGGLWRISSQEMNADTKYHAGAQFSIKRKQISGDFEPPPSVVTDTAVFMLNTGPQRLYFLPDRILIYEGNEIGAVQYANLNCTVQPSIFVESEAVPGDAEVVGRTWLYTNKGGGPDRRFANNPEIPIVRYAQITIRSSGGLNYVIQASNMQRATTFAQAITDYGTHLAYLAQAALQT